MSIAENIHEIKSKIPGHVKLVAVTKTYPPDIIRQAYDAGHRAFGENRVQELVQKYEALPKDIEWHLIGHLQTNKVKYIAHFVSMIHSVDSLKLLKEINKYAEKAGRVIDCLLQIYIAQEETKFGLSFEETDDLLASNELANMKNICISGFMGMASFTQNTSQVRKEFSSLKRFFDSNRKQKTENYKPAVLSMGMSSDYWIAIEEGSTLIRVGSSIFGSRS